MFKTIFLILLYATPALSQTLYTRNKDIMDSVRKVNDSTIALRTAINSVSGGLSANGNGSQLTGLTKTQVGLSNVDNTSDANKPVSGATTTALALKANADSSVWQTKYDSDTGRTNAYAAINGKQAIITAGSISNSMLANGAVANLSGINTGDQTNISGNAATVTTNANLTGDVTSVGNATTIGATKVTNAMLAGSIDLTSKVTGVLPFLNGGIGSTAVTSATTGTISVTMNTEIITCIPSGALTLNGTGGITGQRITFIFTTSGVSSFVVTFGTNFIKTATLATGTTSGKRFCVSFIYDGTNYLETGRTTAM